MELFLVERSAAASKTCLTPWLQTCGGRRQHHDDQGDVDENVLRHRDREQLADIFEVFARKGQIQD